METKYILTSDGELYHWSFGKREPKDDHKYIKREWKNGKWVYTYPEDVKKTSNPTTAVKPKTSGSWLDNLKKLVGKGAKNVLDNVTNAAVAESNKLASNLDNIVNKAKAAVGKFYDDPDNIFNVTRASYDKKIEAIKETKEWQDIVKRNDSEYVKKNADGSTEYLIDDYIVDKKHPVLDVIGDIAAGRKISTQEITKDSLVAGLKDYATTTLEIGMLMVGAAAKGLEKKIKFSMGSYDEEIEQLTTVVNDGAEYVKSVYDESYKVVKSVDPKQVEQLVNVISSVDANAALSTTTRAAEVAKSIDNDAVVDAAMLIMESDTMKEALGSNKYYQEAERVLTNLSDEEIAMINLIIREMRK